MDFGLFTLEVPYKWQQVKQNGIDTLIGLIILISCILITGNYQFNTNINITILWLIPEAYYIAYDVLIAYLIKEIPIPLNINWGFQAKCIYIILSAIFPLIGYTVFKLKRARFIRK